MISPQRRRKDSSGSPCGENERTHRRTLEERPGLTGGNPRGGGGCRHEEDGSRLDGGCDPRAGMVRRGSSRPGGDRRRARRCLGDRQGHLRHQVAGSGEGLRSQQRFSLVSPVQPPRPAGSPGLRNDPTGSGRVVDGEPGCRNLQVPAPQGRGIFDREPGDVRRCALLIPAHEILEGSGRVPGRSDQIGRRDRSLHGAGDPEQPRRDIPRSAGGAGLLHPRQQNRPGRGWGRHGGCRQPR